jgi:toxin CcdB
MARYDVYSNRLGRPNAPYLLDVQSDLIDVFGSRVVVPLLDAASLKRGPAKRLNPVFEIEGRRVVMATHMIFAMPESDLEDAVATLEEAHFEIVNALDMLFQGY